MVRRGSTGSSRTALSIPTDPGLPATIVRDPVTGPATGGIRPPDVAVPIRTITGVHPNAALAGSPLCFLFGARDPWNGDGGHEE